MAITSEVTQRVVEIVEREVSPASLKLVEDRVVATVNANGYWNVRLGDIFLDSGYLDELDLSLDYLFRDNTYLSLVGAKEIADRIAKYFSSDLKKVLFIKNIREIVTYEAYSR